MQYSQNRLLLLLVAYYAYRHRASQPSSADVLGYSFTGIPSAFDVSVGYRAIWPSQESTSSRTRSELGPIATC